MRALSRNIRLAVFFPFLLLCFVRSAAEITVTDLGDGSYMVDPGREYGVFSEPWSFSFGFSDMGIRGILAASEKIPERKDGSIVISLDSPSSYFKTLTLPCESVGDGMFLFDLRKGYAAPGRISRDEAMKSPVRNEALNVSVLETFPVKKITVNGVALAAPYPSCDIFSEIFDKGIGKSPGVAYYDYCRTHRGVKSATCNGDMRSTQIKSRSSLFPEPVEKVDRSSLSIGAYGSTTGGTAFRYDLPYRNFEIADPAEIVRHPFGLAHLAWNSTDKQLMQALVNEKIGFEGLYKYAGSGLWTDIYLNAGFELPDRIEADGATVALKTRLPGANLHLLYETNEKISIYANLYFYADCTGTNRISDKKLNKELTKYFVRLLETLRKDGMDLKMERKNKYSALLSDGLRLTLELNLSKADPFGSSCIDVKIYKHYN